MSYEMQGMSHVGSRPFNHNQSQEAEQEYDRLRDLARQEAGKRSSCMSKSQQAYGRGDGAAAHSLSEEGKQHGARMAEYNKQASDFIFRENNAPGRVAPDTIDLHGQFVEEAEDILEQRISAAKAQGQTHLHVIVGKGNHSPGHIQKIKPRVEQICQQQGLQFHTEPNEGRMYINLTGGAVDPSAVQNWGGYQSQGSYHGGQGQSSYPQQPQHSYGGGQQQQQYGGQQQQQYGGQQNYQQHQQQNYGGGGGQQQQHQQNNNEEYKRMAKKYLPRILRYLQRLLCK